jgi:hypothetical protein
MSIETLLLVILFLVAPFIEMFRAARQRGAQQRRPEAVQRQPVPAPPALPPKMPTEIPPEWMAAPDASPELPAGSDVPLISVPAPGPEVRRDMSYKIAAERRLARKEAAADLLAARREARAGQDVLVGLRSAGGLHRAMVVMAILGPCRAVNPHGWDERDSLR